MPSLGRMRCELITAGRFDVLSVEGGDAVPFLQGLLTQDVIGMEENSVRRSFLLGPQGKLRALLWVAKTKARVWVITDAGTAGTLEADLAHYRMREKIEVSVDPRPVWLVNRPGDGVAITEVVTIGLGDRTVVIGAQPVGRLGTEAETTAARVAIGEPIFGVDVDESTIPQETGLVGEAVSFTKGCYLGQELVARIDTRGHVNRELRRVTSTDPVPVGAKVRHGDKEVGELTTVGDLDGTRVGLGLLKQGAQPGERVELSWPGGSGVGQVVERTGRLTVP